LEIAGIVRQFVAYFVCMDKRFATIQAVAADLGVPRSYLKREAEAGRLPYIKAGRRLLLDREAVALALSQRAQQSAEGGKR
jgi:excisionase family DNA binding protein